VPPAAAPLTLSRALRLFSERRLALVAARHEVSASRAAVVSSAVWQNPWFSISGQGFTHGAVTGGREEISMMLTQALPVTGHLGLRKDAASAAASAEEARFLAIAWQLTGELKRAYVELLFAQGRLKVLSAGLADLERVEHVLEARAKAGANPAYDRLRLQIERDTLRNRASLSEAALIEARAALARAIGGATAPGDCDSVNDLPEPAAPPPADEPLERRALERRPEATLTRLEATAATLRTDVARRRYFPEPQLGFGYSRWFDVPNASPSSGGTWLASLSLPIPILDRGQGTVTQHLETGQAAATRAAIAREEIVRDVDQAAARFRVQFAAYERQKGSIENAESVRRIAELTYKEGRATIVELLDAYSSHLRVAEQSVELRAAVLGGSVALAQAIGP
jgi:cobalt-zinc-cadmium efflux system outer membrane protein